MDSDQGKLFIGGISWETDETKLQEYFSFYGDVSQTVVMRDKATGRPRGFGFVVFSDPSVLDKVLADQHVIDGRTVEAKRALSRDEQNTSARNGSDGNTRNFGSGGNVKTKKIFVGGLPATITEDGFRQYFEAYGTVTDVVVMFDQQTQRPRGFGFISFDTEDAVDRVLHKTFHDLNGKQVEVKRALPKDGNSGGGGGRSMGGAGTGGGGGGYQGYGASGGGSGSYDSRVDTNRYMPSQNTGAGYQTYGSSGYGAGGYGYGPGNNAGFGSYGGYGAANTGYGAPTGAPYGNPNVPSGGYGAASRSSGYGAVGYGNSAAPWGGPNAGAGGPGGGGLGSAASGQSPGGGAYGYGGGMDGGSYANQGPYGAVGGRASVPNSNVSAGGVDVPGGGGGGYMGGGYGDSNGNSGYGNQGWRSDPSQPSGNYGGAAGYGGGYGAPARQ